MTSSVYRRWLLLALVLGLLLVQRDGGHRVFEQYR